MMPEREYWKWVIWNFIVAIQDDTDYFIYRDSNKDNIQKAVIRRKQIKILLWYRGCNWPEQTDSWV